MYFIIEAHKGPFKFRNRLEEEFILSAMRAVSSPGNFMPGQTLASRRISALFPVRTSDYHFAWDGGLEMEAVLSGHCSHVTQSHAG